MALRAATVLLSLMGSASASKVPATPSAGCARGYETATAGTATAATLVVGNSSTATRTYTVYVPTVADRTRARSGDGLAQPLPLVLNFHGWKSTGTELMNNSDGNDVAEANGFLNVYPDGMGDHPSATLDGPSGWGSWNTGGSTASPGPAGPTCNGDHSADALCYTSCAQRPGGCDAQGCDWTTCADDLGFVEALLDHLESTMCVDRNRVYATGFSNGAMLVYTLGMALSQRFAAIAPVEGGVHPGFLSRPEVPVALLEIHGTQDVTVPINGSDGITTTSNASGLPISNDGWFYTNLSTQMVHWRDANNCTGNSTRYTTEYDGTDDLWCVREGHCRNAELDRLSPRRTVVRCSWGGSHHVPGAQDDDLNSVGTPDWWGMKLIWKFFEAHARMLP